MKLLEILTGGKATEIISTVGEAIDKNIYSKEEKAADSLKAEELSLEAEERRIALDQQELNKRIDSYIKLSELAVENTKDARAREVAIIQAPNAGWLNKNIMPLIASFILLSTLIMYLILIYKRNVIVAIDMAVVGSIIDTFKTLSTLIVGYYFGSSLSSKNKDEILKNTTTK